MEAFVALATGKAANGKMAENNRADPHSRDFAKFLEGLLLIAAGSGAGATFLFKRVKQHGKKGDEFVSTNFRLAFGEQVFCDRILKFKLAAHGAVIKKEYTITMRYDWLPSLRNAGQTTTQGNGRSERQSRRRNERGY